MEEPKFMQELHKIRRQMYEEWKNMTDEEMFASIEKGAEMMRKKLVELNRDD